MISYIQNVLRRCRKIAMDGADWCEVLKRYKNMNAPLICPRHFGSSWDTSALVPKCLPLDDTEMRAGEKAVSTDNIRLVNVTHNSQQLTYPGECWQNHLNRLWKSSSNFSRRRKSCRPDEQQQMTCKHLKFKWLQPAAITKKKRKCPIDRYCGNRCCNIIMS